MNEKNLAEELFTLNHSIFDSPEWAEMEKREFSAGPDALLEALIQQHEWSNAEMMWVLKYMMYHYGGKDTLLKNIPADRHFMNMMDVLRVMYILIDHINPELDLNMRRYLTVKLADATWGINEHTRPYLTKIQNKTLNQEDTGENPRGNR